MNQREYTKYDINDMAFLSYAKYKAPTRLTEIHQDGLTDRRLVKGKSGARYYEYRIKPKHV